MPKMYPIDPEKSVISERCHQRVIVMDEVGNDDWRNPASWNLKHLYIRLAYALAALRALHATGLSHGDNKYNSIRGRSPIRREYTLLISITPAWAGLQLILKRCII
jgi:hypothetical protein